MQINQQQCCLYWKSILLSFLSANISITFSLKPLISFIMSFSTLRCFIKTRGLHSPRFLPTSARSPLFSRDHALDCPSQPVADSREPATARDSAGLCNRPRLDNRRTPFTGTAPRNNRPTRRSKYLMPSFRKRKEY